MYSVGSSDGILRVAGLAEILAEEIDVNGRPLGIYPQGLRGDAAPPVPVIGRSGPNSKRNQSPISREASRRRSASATSRATVQ
jgi:hypothetical protein